MRGSVARSCPSPRRCRGRPPAPERLGASVPAARSGGGRRAGGTGSPAAASPVCSQPIHSGCVTCDGPDVTVTASQTSFRGTSSLRRGLRESAVSVAPAPEPIFLSFRLGLCKRLPILQSSAPRLGARTRSRHGLEAVNDSGNASEGVRLPNWEGSKKNKI